MRGGGAVDGRRRPSPTRRGRVPLAAEPSLQGAFAGQSGRVGIRGQTDADVARSPGRVELPQRHGVGSERMVFGGSARPGPISRPRGVGWVTSPLEQVSDRARTEVQVAGDGRRGLPTIGSKLDEASECRRKGSGHGDSPGGWQDLTTGDYPLPQGGKSGKTFFVGIRGKTYGRVTGASAP